VIRNKLGIFYIILVVLLLILGAWWIYFLASVGQDQAEARMQKLANDRIHATFLLQSEPMIREDPEGWLGPSFPYLKFTKTETGVDVKVDPVVAKQIQDDARATRNMFMYEGFFFIILLVAGSTILFVSWRSELRFTQTRELFLAGVTHEFKTPLASLKLYTETLNRTELGDEDRTRIRERMGLDIRRLETLVNDILSMSAADAFERGPNQPVELKEQCTMVVSDLLGFAKDHQATFTVEGDDRATSEVNPMAFDLALRNLLVNAVHHSPDPVKVQVQVTRDARWNRVSVRDDGPGIPKRLQDKVFELFYSGKRESRPSGGGVGLHLVKRNTENLGGRLELDSEPGRGSTFTMILPAAQPAPHPGGPA
jgi:signal transduction histidine kinase